MTKTRKYSQPWKKIQRASQDNVRHLYKSGFCSSSCLLQIGGFASLFTTKLPDFVVEISAQLFELVCL